MSKLKKGDLLNNHLGIKQYEWTEEESDLLFHECIEVIRDGKPIIHGIKNAIKHLDRNESSCRGKFKGMALKFPHDVNDAILESPNPNAYRRLRANLFELDEFRVEYVGKEFKRMTRFDLINRVIEQTQAVKEKEDKIHALEKENWRLLAKYDKYGRNEQDGEGRTDL